MNNHFKNQYATIDYDQSKNTLMLTWHRFAQEDAFRSVMTKFYDLSTQLKVSKWLFDSRKQGLISSKDQKWTVSEVVNRKLDTTQIKTAVVMPENTFMKVSVNKITSELETQAADQNYQLFKSPEQALTWLDQ
ncbi:MAG TPA: hypothetical protein DCS93_31250 [Microscillaceae bacterium]|nr:hypothetical protein [Microscillaceae bacterium]